MTTITQQQAKLLYGNVITDNMKDEDLLNFSGYLLKHDFKKIKTKVYKLNKSYSNQYYNPNMISFPIEPNWEKMSDSAKFSILIRKFGLTETLKDWLIVLPEIKQVLKEINKFDKKELYDLLCKLS